jgi:TonB-linked SusC/RagA family outer membrane protein
MKKPDHLCLLNLILSQRKTFLIMKLTAFLLTFGVLQTTAVTFSQTARLSLAMKDAPVSLVFQEIEKQTNFRFLYRNEMVEDQIVTVDARNLSIENVLDQALKDVRVEYQILDNNLIVITPSRVERVAQQLQVKGVVTSGTDNTPLPGVNVVEKGTQNGVVTDLNGKFSITLNDPSSVLVFSFVGFLTEEVAVAGLTSIDVVLVEDIQKLDEIIVIGYGTTKKSDLTGAVASVSEETLRSSVSTNIDQALQGRVAGVQVTQNSGQPGGATSIRIRGASSITGSSEPLYVVDGIPFQGDATSTAGFDWAGGANGQSKVNPLSTINPNDIVNIEVLKDASASAIYGSRAANGVVLVTTKRGKQGTGTLSYSMYYALQNLPKKLEMMNLQEFADYQVQIAEELSLQPNERYLDPSLLGKGTDWQDEVFDPAWTGSHQLSVTGGTEKTDYAISGGYYKQEGIIIGSNFKRFTGRINLNSQVKDWIKVGGNLAYAKTSEKITLNDGGDGVIMNALLMQPDIPVKNMDGEYAGPDVTYAGSNYNPVALALLRNNTLNRERIMANIYGDATIIKGLTFRTELGFDNNNSINVAFHPTYQFGAIKNDVNKMRQRDENSFFWIWKNYLTYALALAEKHNITAMAGTEAQKSQWEGTDVTKEGFTSNDIHVLSQGDNTTSRTNGWKGASSIVSYFGRFNYNYADRYLLTFTLRADGSSKFGSNNKWGYFPSGSFAWRVSNEAFMKNIDFIHNMKIRLGYGLVGNQAIDNYLYGSSMVTKDSPFGTTYRMEKISNPDLKWESTAMYNIGLDLAILQGRVDMTFDWFNKQTEDMLLQLSVPSYLGGPNNWEDIAAPYANVGKMENKGYEISVNSRNINRGKFTWSTTLTYSHVKNLVKELDDESSVYWGSLYWYSEFQTATKTCVGQPLGVFYGYETEGIFANADDIRNHATQIVDPETVTEENPNGENLINKTTGVWIGDIKFRDRNGDGIVNTDDQTIIGDPNPEFTFGLNNSVTYGPVDFSIYLSGSYGADILNYSRVSIEGQTSVYSNQAKTVTGRAQYAYTDPGGLTTDPDNVTLANPGTDMPRFATNDVNRNNRMSDRFIEDGSYLRVQNLTLAYTFPGKWTQKIRMSRLRLYINAQNLYTLTNYSGYDPEIGAFEQNARKQNIDMGRYPSPRMITFGLDVDF